MNPDKLSYNKLQQVTTAELLDKQDVITRQMIESERFNSLVSMLADFATIFDKPLDLESQTLITNLIQDKIVPHIRAFYNERFGIDIGPVDLITGIRFLQTKHSNQGGNAGGFVRLEGKRANNVMGINKGLVNNFRNEQAGTQTDADAFESRMTNFVALYQAICHEIHHRLLNLDSSMDLKNGSNINSSLIANKQREGFVEYLSQQCSAKSISTLFPDFLSEAVIAKFLSSGLASEKYNSYTDSVRKYLESLVQAIMKNKFDNNPKTYPQAQKYIQKLFVNFFLSGDRQILDIAIENKMPTILDLKAT